MAVRSHDFVGIAEGIRSLEQSVKGRIERLKRHISELSGKKTNLEGSASYLEAAIAAAYEDTDEDGDPDYGLIASLQAQLQETENELYGVEQDLEKDGGELEEAQLEYEQNEEEKVRTLFEIQEHARVTSNNIAVAGGMYGAYAGVGASLQSSQKSSLSDLSQAAAILGGSVSSAGASHAAGGSGSAYGGGAGGRAGMEPASGTAAFSSAWKASAGKDSAVGNNTGVTESHAGQIETSAGNKTKAEERREFTRWLRSGTAPTGANDPQGGNGATGGGGSTASGTASSDAAPDIDQRIRIKERDDDERALFAAMGLTHLADGGFLAEMETSTGSASDTETRRNHQGQGLNADIHTAATNQILSHSRNTAAQSQLLKQPRSLTVTRQSWTINRDGTRTYNKPYETQGKLDFKQGKVTGFLGTCGLVSDTNVLRLAGIPVSEEEIVRYASGEGLCRVGRYAEENGGTGAGDRKRLLEHYGIPGYTAPQSIQTIAKAVAEGRGVIISVDAYVLYDMKSVDTAPHAVTVTSVRTDEKGEVIGFYLCDSNMGEHGTSYYSAEKLEKALTQRECNITSTIIR